MSSCAVEDLSIGSHTAISLINYISLFNLVYLFTEQMSVKLRSIELQCIYW